jgi:hypothetical protein
MQTLSQLHTPSIFARTIVSHFRISSTCAYESGKLWLGGGATADAVRTLATLFDRL